MVLATTAKPFGRSGTRYFLMKVFNDCQEPADTISLAAIPLYQARDVANLRLSCPLPRLPGSSQSIDLASQYEIPAALSALPVLGWENSSELTFSSFKIVFQR